MLVRDIMTQCVKPCSSQATLADAARIMWDCDCGFVPVVDPDEERLCGVLTDRDICLVAWELAAPLGQIPVSAAMSRELWTIGPDDSIESAHAAFRERHVRRLPVVTSDGALSGVLSLADLACCDEADGEVATTLRELSRQRFPSIP